MTNEKYLTKFIIALVKSMRATRALCSFFIKHAKNNLLVASQESFSFNFNASLIIDIILQNTFILNLY